METEGNPSRRPCTEGRWKGRESSCGGRVFVSGSAKEEPPWANQSPATQPTSPWFLPQRSLEPLSTPLFLRLFFAERLSAAPFSLIMI